MMEVPRIRKITLNMGVGEAVADKKVMDNAVGDMQKDCRSKTCGNQGKKIHRDLQGTGWLSGWLHGHIAAYAHVRISGSPG